MINYILLNFKKICNYGSTLVWKYVCVLFYNYTLYNMLFLSILFFFIIEIKLLLFIFLTLFQEKTFNNFSILKRLNLLGIDLTLISGANFFCKI